MNEHFAGHGIGKEMHCEPLIFHNLENQNDSEMQVGNTFTIEPVFLLREANEYKMWRDGWTFTAPGIPSAQWEHTVLITE